MATDLLLGGVTGGVAGRVGALAQTSNRPYTIGQLPAGLMGATGKSGQIRIQPGLTAADFAETLRHETVHSILTPSRIELAQITTGMYKHSHLWRYAEEAAAESYGTLSIPKGLSFPLTAGGYELQPWRVGAEALGVGGLGFGGYKLVGSVIGED
jgi:hypothetical protein